MHDPDVVASIDSDANRLTKNPVIRQGLRPERIDFERGHLFAREPLCGGDAAEGEARHDERSDNREEERNDRGLPQNSHARPHTQLNSWWVGSISAASL